MDALPFGDEIGVAARHQRREALAHLGARRRLQLVGRRAVHHGVGIDFGDPVEVVRPGALCIVNAHFLGNPF